jgi:hypothetical protein
MQLGNSKFKVLLVPGNEIQVLTMFSRNTEQVIGLYASAKVLPPHVLSPDCCIGLRCLDAMTYGRRVRSAGNTKSAEESNDLTHKLRLQDECSYYALHSNFNLRRAVNDAFEPRRKSGPQNRESSGRASTPETGHVRTNTKDSIPVRILLAARRIKSIVP